MGLQKKKSFKHYLIRKLAKWLITALIFTCRLRIIGYETAAGLRAQGTPIIYVYWHRHIFVTIHRFRKTGARPLISLSEDGEIVAQVAEEFGMNPVRGSTSRGGARAFLELANLVKAEKCEVLITADGPRGPVREIKDGTLHLAAKTGAVLVPVAWHARKVKILEKSWDKFKIPLPFNSVVYAYGAPFIIPPGSVREDYPRLAGLLKMAIDKLETETERSFS